MYKIITMGMVFCLVYGSGLINAAEQSLSANTNKRVLENTVDSLSISSVVKPAIRGGSTIAIRNIETETTSDQKIVALIEDQMLIDLVSSGYVVLERDSNAIRRVIEEGGRNNFSIIRGDMQFLDQTRNIDVNSKNGKDSAVVLVKDPAVAEDDKKHLLLTHLKSADYILSYRIQELGINYEDLDSKNVKRNSVARLHIRIEEVSTGKIVLAKNIESTAKDVVPSDMVKTLAYNSRSQFYQGYPGQNPDEDNLYVQSDKHVYIQMALLNTFTDQTGGFGIKSPIQIGLMYGDERIAYETLTGNTENTTAGVITQMKQEAALLVYGRNMGKVALGSVNTNVVAELGLGNGSLTNWDSAKGPVVEKGIGAKLGIGLETQVYPRVDLRLAADYYLVGKNSLALGTMSVRYRF